MAIWTYSGAICGSEGNYGIVFRDFPGCTSTGETIEDVTRNGHEALQGHIDVMLDYGDVVPEPSSHSLAEVAAWLAEPDDDEPDQWVALVPIAVAVSTRPNVVHIDLPRRLLAEIDDVSADARAFILDATRRELERLKKPA